MLAPNRNILWSQIFVDELARSGLEAVCIAPGSRSTPLVMAFSQQPEIKIYSHLDERSAAFFALGLALASDKPVAILCTSGTATANFYPAVIEAYQSQVPLLVLTADRSHELRESGANQTIDQVKMYGDHALWSVDVAPPEANSPALLIRSLRTLACRAYAEANGLRKGPVHLNFPFRKPLEPTPVESDVTSLIDEALGRADNAPFTIFSRGAITPSQSQVDTMVTIINKYERGLIICGPHCPGLDFPECVRELSAKSRYPIIADALSGIRFGGSPCISTYDNFISSSEAPDVVIRFGDVPTSAVLNDYLNRARPHYIFHLDEAGRWADDNHRITHFVQAHPAQLCLVLTEAIEQRSTSEWYDHFYQIDDTVRQIINDEIDHGDYFDGAVLNDLVKIIPPESTLFVGNSLPVRHFDQFSGSNSSRIHVYANRGASGIDGVISSALGTGASRLDKPLVLVIGDVSFYHDMNGLLAIKRCGIPITIILLNNNGGGIFYRLPINGFEPAFTDLFITPHDLEFEHVARMYGLDYICVDDRESFRQAFKESVGQPNSCLIEVRTDALKDAQRRREIMDAVKVPITQI